MVGFGALRSEFFRTITPANGKGKNNLIRSVIYILKMY
jgi:hypothetical protein